MNWMYGNRQECVSCCAELPRMELQLSWALSLKQPLLFAKSFLPHFNHILLLEPSIIPCLPWPQVWNNMIQDKPLKFLPQRLLIWSRSRAFAFGPQTLERHENKLLVPSYLQLGKACLYKERMKLSHKYKSVQKGWREERDGERVCVSGEKDGDRSSCFTAGSTNSPTA